jgi:predicted MFS family arabinose efflux permease
MPHRGTILLLVMMQVTHIVEFMIMMPLGGVLMRLFSLTATQFSLAIASYTFAAGVSSLLFAGFADRFDRKRLLLFVYAGLAVATLACALAQTFPMLVAARIVAGVFGGLMSAIVYAIASDLVPPSHRGRAMGLLGVAFPMAATIGVPFSLFIATHGFGWRSPFVVLTAASVVLLILAWKKLPTMRDHLINPSGGAATVRSPFSVLSDVLNDRNHLTAFALTALVTFSGFSVIPFIAPVLTQNKVIAESMLPWAYAIGGVATFFSVQRVGALSDRLGHLKVFRVMTLCFIVPVILMTLQVPGPLAWVFFVWAAFMVFASARWTPALALVTSASEARTRGSFLSVNSALMQFASAAGTFVAGLILHTRADGMIERYGVVGALSIVVGLIAYVLAARVRSVA